MKNGIYVVLMLLGLSAVLVSGSCGKKGKTAGSEDKIEKKSNASHASNDSLNGPRIGFYYVDSLNEKYQLVIDVSKDIERKVKAKTSSFENEVRNFENWAKDMEKKMREGSLLTSEEKKFMEQYQRRSQELAQKEQRLGAELQEMQMNELMRANNRVNAFVKDFALENGYDMILQYQLGGQIIYINEAYDVTEEIINGLNEEYKNTSAELNK